MSDVFLFLSCGNYLRAPHVKTSGHACGHHDGFTDMVRGGQHTPAQHGLPWAPHPRRIGGGVRFIDVQSSAQAAATSDDGPLALRRLRLEARLLRLLEVKDEVDEGGDASDGEADADNDLDRVSARGLDPKRARGTPPV